MSGNMIKRLDLPTLRINTEEPRLLKFGLKKYQGFKGDTVATALYAGGIRIFSRSPKYRRPRGLCSLDGIYAASFMEINGQPDIPAETALLENSMKVRAQNIRFSLKRDYTAFMDRLDWIMPSGIPVKKNIKPDNSGFSENIVPVRHIHGDVCILGGGAAGMTAALVAAEQGLRVILTERRPWLGGSFDYRIGADNRDIPLYFHARELARRISEMPNIRLFCNSTVTGIDVSGHVTVLQTGSSGLVEINAKNLVIATGCSERPLLFEHNDRPGVMTVETAWRMAAVYGILPGRKAVVCTGHDTGLEAAMALHDAGLDIAVIADCREEGRSAELLAGIRRRNMLLLSGWTVREAHGKQALKSVTLSRTDGHETRRVECDLLAASAGPTPNIRPLVQVGVELKHEEDTGCFLSVPLPHHVLAAGRILGLEDPDAIAVSGELAGLRAAALCGAPVAESIANTMIRMKKLPGPVSWPRFLQVPGPEQRVFIWPNRDITIRDVRKTCRKNISPAELGTYFSDADPGTLRNLSIAMDQYMDKPAGTAGPELVRGAYAAAPFSDTFSGPEPLRRSPVYDVLLENNAVTDVREGWIQALRFTPDTSAREEIGNVRTRAGIMDASPTGKFRIFGPDAEKAMQRIFIGNMADLRPGQAVYSAMCAPDGSLVDAGFVVRQGDGDFFFTTTPGRAAQTGAWFRLHTREEDWQFHMVCLTDALGTIRLAGPRARDVLQRYTEANLSAQAFPLSGYRTFLLKYRIPVRVLFTGELDALTYDVHVPASLMEAAWNILLDAGKNSGLKPFGLTAETVLRLETGHIAVDREAASRVMLPDLGLGELWYPEKAFLRPVGDAALRRTEYRDERRVRIGFRVEKAGNVPRIPEDGAIIQDQGMEVGRVCLCRYSFALGESIGTALVAPHLASPGTRLALFADRNVREPVYATVVPMPFHPAEIRIPENSVSTDHF